MEFDGKDFVLVTKQKACLASDACGIAPLKQKIEIQQLQGAEKNSCQLGCGVPKLYSYIVASSIWWKSPNSGMGFYKQLSLKILTEVHMFIGLNKFSEKNFIGATAK